MYEEICQKCNVTFFTPTAFKQHICAPPPANDELREMAKQLASAVGDKNARGPIWMQDIEELALPLLAQVAARARLSEARDWLMSEGLPNKARLEWKRKRVADLERGAELQKAVTG